MRCEVIRFKPVRSGRVAIVKTQTEPPVMGEVPVTKAAQIEVGDIVTMKIWFVQDAGRIKAKCYLNGSVE